MHIQRYDKWGSAPIRPSLTDQITTGRYIIPTANLILWTDQGNYRSGTSAATLDDLSGKEITGQDSDMAQATAGSQPTVVPGWNGYRTYDGSADYLYQKVYDDETGITDYRLSLVDGNAFLWLYGLDLPTLGWNGTTGSDTPYAVILDDGTNKSHAYIGSAEAGEALGSELFTTNNDFEAGGTGGDFDSGNELDDGTSDNFDDWVEQGVNDGNGDKVEATATKHGGSVAAKLTYTTGTVGMQSPAGGITVVPRKLYKLSLWTRGDNSISGNYIIYDRTNSGAIQDDVSTGITGTSYTEFITYFTAPIDCIAVDINLRCKSAGTVYYDDVSVKEITEGETTACALVSTKDGSTRNMASQHASFDPNAVTAVQIVKSDFHAISAAATWSLWIKPADGHPTNDEVIGGQWVATDGYRKYNITLLNTGDANAGKLVFYASDDGADNGDYQITDAAVFADGATSWTHIAIVYDGSGPTAVWYVNGVLVASTNAGGGMVATIFDTAELTVFGSMSTPASYFAGDIGPVMVFNAALTATQIKQLYDRDRGRL